MKKGDVLVSIHGLKECVIVGFLSDGMAVIERINAADNALLSVCPVEKIKSNYYEVKHMPATDGINKNVAMGIAGENISKGDAVECDVKTGKLIKVRPTEKGRMQQIKEMVCDQLDRADAGTIEYEAKTDILTQPTAMDYVEHSAGTTHISLKFDVLRRDKR